MGAAGKEQCQKLCLWIPFLQRKEIRTQVLDSEPADQSDVSVQSVPPGGFCHGRGGNELSPPHCTHCCMSQTRGWQQAGPPGRASPAHPGLQAGFRLHVGALKMSPCVFISRTTLQRSPCCTGFVPPWLKVEFCHNIAVKLLKEFRLVYLTCGDDYRKIILSAHVLFLNVSSTVCIETQTLKLQKVWMLVK